MLERLEANRVHHLAQATRGWSSCGRSTSAARARRRVLRRLLESSAFAVAERLSRLRMPRGHRAPSSPSCPRTRSARA